MEDTDKIKIRLSTFDHEFHEELHKEASSLEDQYGFKVFVVWMGAAYEPEAARHVSVLIFELGKDVAISLLSAWLYDKLKGRNDSKITIGETEVPADKEAIERIIVIEMKKRASKG